MEAGTSGAGGCWGELEAWGSLELTRSLVSVELPMAPRVGRCGVRQGPEFLGAHRKPCHVSMSAAWGLGGAWGCWSR